MHIRRKFELLRGKHGQKLEFIKALSCNIFFFTNFPGCSINERHSPIRPFTITVTRYIIMCSISARGSETRTLRKEGEEIPWKGVGGELPRIKRTDKLRNEDGLRRVNEKEEIHLAYSLFL